MISLPNPYRPLTSIQDLTKLNKENTLTRDQIQSLFITYLNTLSDKELTKLVKRVKPELIENITLSIT